MSTRWHSTHSGKSYPMVTKWKSTTPSYTASNRPPNTPCSTAKDFDGKSTSDLHRQPRSNREIRTLKPGPDQEISIALAHISTKLAALKCTLIIQWVPGHTDVAGNEIADELAKFATTQQPPAFFRTPISCLKSSKIEDGKRMEVMAGLHPVEMNLVLWTLPTETRQNL